MSTSQDVSTKIQSLRSDIFSILKALLVIEANQGNLQDKRVFTATDVLEALTFMDGVITSRLEGDINEWKNDNKIQFRSLFHSIEEQVKGTIIAGFVTTQSKTLRFVHTFNTLLVERFIMLLKLIGPAGSQTMSPLLIAELIQFIENLDDEADSNLQAANESLNMLRTSPISKKQLTNKQERGEYIRSLFIRLKEAA